jgi:RNA polymerase sigma-70 factor (ECF subfamily)
MTDADHVLVLQSQDGSLDAFESLIRHHQTMVHALTFRMTGSAADAEDLAQETFIRAFHEIQRFNGSSKFSTWLCSIAVHACLNWRRNEGRRFRAQARCAEDLLVRQTPAADARVENEMARQAQTALLRLPAKQRAVMVLTVYQGLNHAEAAKVLGCSETTVSWRVFAAKKKLKYWLNSGGQKP